MPCFIRIFSQVFEKAKSRYFITPNNEEEEELDGLLRKKLEELSNKPIRTHQELKTELNRLKNEDPRTFSLLEKWLLEQLRKLRKVTTTPVFEEKKKEKPKQKNKKKKREIVMHV